MHSTIPGGLSKPTNASRGVDDMLCKIISTELYGLSQNLILCRRNGQTQRSVVFPSFAHALFLETHRRRSHQLVASSHREAVAVQLRSVGTMEPPQAAVEARKAQLRAAMSQEELDELSEMRQAFAHMSPHEQYLALDHDIVTGFFEAYIEYYGLTEEADLAAAICLYA